MKFFGKTHIIILWVIAFTFAVYIEIVLINSYYVAKRYDETHFPCTYIEGICTKKPTYENCKHWQIPDDVCERRINGRN
jgi:hypothetical protein|tara:strand:- start:814 stop:1050 length:237 start_codon:yes stop_codon:yes gene_type:complete